MPLFSRVGSRRSALARVHLVGTYHPRTGWSVCPRRARLTPGIVVDLHEQGVSLLRVRRRRAVEELSVSRLMEEPVTRATGRAW